MAMGTELIVENFMVWVVSATDKKRHYRTPALQDNILLLAEGLTQRSPTVRWALRSRWAHILHFLGATLALAFAGVFDQVPYSGFGLMSRVVLTIALSRSIRVLSFWSTVLPSPRPGCYLRRFPRDVPQDWWGFIKFGVLAIRGFGGCNDLIFSGHCGIWTLAPLVFRAYYPSPALQALLWLALAQTSLRDVLERQHYSVDMILAVVVTWAVWGWLEGLYPPRETLPRRPPGVPPDPLSWMVLALIVGVLSIAAMIVIGGGA